MRKDLESYTVVQHPKLEVRETEWRKNIERDLGFGPEHSYEYCMTLDLGQKNPHRQTKTAKEQMKAAKGGYEGLRKKYMRIK